MANIVFTSVHSAADKTAGSVEYPVYEPAKTLSNIKQMEPDNNKVSDLPDRRAYRSMNRAAIILGGAAMTAKEFIDSKATDRFRVGFYCATDNGPDNFKCAKGAPENKTAEFAEHYRKNRSPKDYLKQLPNLVPAQIAIFLELLGPLNVYNNSQWGSLQAMEQAEFDLQNDLVDLAVVAATNSVEDPLRAERRLQNELKEGQCLCEGAAVIVLEKGDGRNWAAELESLPNSENYYGIADSVVRFAEAYKS